ncbi:hypothetical protein HCO87_003112 [Salmonella enterica subsp. enterica serovar Reading]|nr:hypothetical protein [Salmonella enterica subsp. enterica serovar Reading]
MAENYKKHTEKLCRKIARSYMHHVLRDSGRPVAFVKADNRKRVQVMLDEASLATCIRKGLVATAEKEYPGKAGKAFAVYMLNICLDGDEISKEGLEVMKSVLTDGVNSVLDLEKNNG